MRLALALLLTACGSTSNPAPIPASATQQPAIEPEAVTTVPLAITIDDLPWVGPLSPGDRTELAVGRILEQLDGAPVTGFFTCRNGRSRADAWDAWIAAPIELGNHTRSHRSLDDLGLEAWQRDVAACQARIEESSGRSVPWFRYPFLRTGSERELRDAGFAFLAELGLRRAPVSIDVSDWALAREYAASRDPAVAEAYIDHVRRAARRYRSIAANQGHAGAPQVLLLHANALAADHLGALLAALSGDGFHFVSLDEAMADPLYAEPDGYVGPVGLSWLYRVSNTPDAWAWDAAQLHAIEVRFGDRRERASFDLDAELRVRQRDDRSWVVDYGSARSFLAELEDGSLLFVDPPSDEYRARSLLDWAATRYGPRRLVVARSTQDHEGNTVYVEAGAQTGPTDPSIGQIVEGFLTGE